MNSIFNDFKNISKYDFKIPIGKIEKKQIHLFDGNEEHAIKLSSSKVFANMPRRTFLERIGFKKQPVILHIVDIEGKEGYIRLNRASFCEKFKIKKETIDNIWDATTSVELKMLMVGKKPEDIDPAKCYLIGELYVNKGDLDTAIPYFNRALQAKNKYQYSAAYKLAKCYEAKGQTDKVEELLKKSLEARHELYPQAKLELAKFYAKTGDELNAYRYFEGIIKDKEIKKEFRVAATNNLNKLLKSHDKPYFPQT